MLINPRFKSLKCGKCLLQAENAQLDGTGPSRRYLCHQLQTAKFLISKIMTFHSERFKDYNYLNESIHQSINLSVNQSHWKTNAQIGLQTVHNCVVPLGLDPIGKDGMDSDVCMHALHIMGTETGRWPATGQNYDTHVKSVLIYNYYFIYFIILTFWITYYFALYFPHWCISVCTPLYWRLSEDHTSAPKHVVLIKYVKGPTNAFWFYGYDFIA
jgi:hypothetical protein